MKPSKETQPTRVASENALAFSGHETFVFRYGWLKKAIDAVADNPETFVSEDAMSVLGVGKNMVRSIRYWALATRVLEEEPKTRGAKLKPTALGQLLLGQSGLDPYLEDVNSLWALHWNLSTNERRCTTWCWAFNLPAGNEFTRESLEILFGEELLRRESKVPSENSLGRDIDCFLRTYATPRDHRDSVLEDSLDCPLVELQLLEEDEAPGLFYFRRGEQNTLSDEVFVYALLDFWQRVAPNRETLAFADIAYGFASLGSSFKFDENSLVERLERLERTTAGSLLYTETAGLKQVYRQRPLNPLTIFEQHYEHAENTVLRGA